MCVFKGEGWYSFIVWLLKFGFVLLVVVILDVVKLYVVYLYGMLGFGLLVFVIVY